MVALCASAVVELFQASSRNTSEGISEEEGLFANSSISSSGALRV